MAHCSCKVVAPGLVAFDSNVLTAFLQANAKVVASVGSQRAVFQLFMYASNLVILPTVTKEAERIPAEHRREEHMKWIFFHFEERFPVGAVVEERAKDLLRHHSDLDNCRIVAEAEVAGMDVLVSMDKNLPKRLQGHTRVRILTPEAACTHLGLAPGTSPEREPGHGHPLAGSTWWRL